MEGLIFISHIAEETEVATALQKLIKDNFPQPLNIFVSSDGESIKMGRDWPKIVLTKLRECTVQIVICSPKSVTREWINLETGAALVRENIPIIPVCHSGTIPSKLPIPLLLRQGVKLTDIEKMKVMIDNLAHDLNIQTPTIDFTKFIESIRAFEDRYTFWDDCNSAFGIIVGIHPKIIPSLCTHSYLEMDLPEKSICAIEQLIPFLRSRELLSFHRTGGSFTWAPFVPKGESEAVEPNLNAPANNVNFGGTCYGCELKKLSKLDAIMASPHFKPTISQLATVHENVLPDWMVKPCEH
jgi:hypothetical protein